MKSVGERLRLERQSQGLSLAKIAEQTRISERYLTAIEASDPEGLPGEFVFRSFVRQYAIALRLDPADFEADLDAMFPTDKDPPTAAPALRDRGFDVPPIDNSLNGGGWSLRHWPVSLGLFVFVLLACSGLYSVWQRSQQPRSVAAKQDAEPAAQQPVVVPPVPAPAEPAQASQEQPPAQAPSAVQTELPKPPESATQQAPAVQPAPPPAAAAGEGNVELEISALSDTWFSLQSGSKTLFTSVLKSGLTRTWKVQDRAKLLVGNAAGIEMKVNGKPIGPIGPSGQVRVVIVTPEGAQIVNPKKPAAE